MASKAKQSPQKESPRSKRQREEDISDDPKALFDQPLVIEGKRKRKSTEMFSFGAPQADRPQQAVEYHGGKGAKFGDIDIIEYYINKVKTDDLKVLYKMCYENLVNATKVSIKKNLRSFNGWDFDTESETYTNRRSMIEKYSVAVLKVVCEYLGLDKNGIKEELVNRICNFLLEPTDEGKVAPVVKKKRKSSTGAPVEKKKKKMDDDQEDESDGERDDEPKEDVMEGTDEGEEKMEESEEVHPPADDEDKVENGDNNEAKDEADIKDQTESKDDQPAEPSNQEPQKDQIKSSKDQIESNDDQPKDNNGDSVRDVGDAKPRPSSSTTTTQEQPSNQEE